MHCILPRIAFADAFSRALAFAPKRSPKAVLNNVFLSVSGKQATLLATDMELGISVSLGGENDIDVDVKRPGACLLHTDRFDRIIRESADETVSLKYDAAGLLIQGERSEFKLVCQDPGDFPAAVAADMSQHHAVACADLKELLRSTMFAADAQSSRFALGGVMLEFGETELIGVATDGRRLAKMAIAATRVAEHAPSDTIVPLRACKLLASKLPDDGACKLALCGNRLLVQFEGTTIWTLLVEGRFPRWRDVLPKGSSTPLTLASEDLLTAIRQVSITATQESVGCDITLAAGALSLVTQAADAGQSRVELPLDYEGEPLAIMLNPFFVADFLRVLSKDQVTLSIINSDRPFVMQAGDRQCIVMPMARDR